MTQDFKFSLGMKGCKLEPHCETQGLALKRRVSSWNSFIVGRQGVSRKARMLYMVIGIDLFHSLDSARF